jgi:ribonuclease-3
VTRLPVFRGVRIPSGRSMTIEKERKKVLRSLQKKLGYRFKNLELSNQALCHRSYAHETPGLAGQDNERLEFLGDALLGLTIGHLLMERRPEDSEGSLSRLRAAVVNENRLALVAREIELGSYLLLGKGEEQTGGREKYSILAASLEALVGAIYLDGGFKKAFRFISELFSRHLSAAEKEGYLQDFKTKLQELAQEVLKATPRYVLTKEWGPDHNKVFGVKVLIQKRVAAVGAGKSKKEAEQKAAQKTLERFPNFVEKIDGGK